MLTVMDSLSVNNLSSVIDNKDNFPDPNLSFNFINERINLLKKENIKILIQDAEIIIRCVKL